MTKCGWFNIQKSIAIIHYCEKKFKELYDNLKRFKKSIQQSPTSISNKNSQQIRTRRKLPQSLSWIKGIYETL